MMKHSIALLVAVATSALAGCQLYFGDENNNGTWNYCGEDGFYECEGDDCYWRGPECPSGWGQGSGGTPPGYECDSDTDCAAGCYCGDGVCEEAGFCTQDSDCGEGYVCDESRSSCTPDDNTTCSDNSDCANGSVCENGTCVSTCSCTSDQEATAQGYDFCDEWRGTCMTGADPAGTCAGEPTCNTVAPTCAPGDVPLLGADGCWTGECQSTQHCAENPPCDRINDQDSCLARTADCSPVYTGLNCTKPDGSACQSGDLNCTCTQFVWDECRTKTSSPRIITLEDGTQVPGILVLK